MHLEKFRLDQIQNDLAPIGQYSLPHDRYLVNRARWLDHYYERNVIFQLRMHLGKF